MQPPRYAPGVPPDGGDRRDGARSAQGAHIGPYCFVDEGAAIGRNAVLHSFVTIYPGAQIGDDFFAARARRRARRLPHRRPRALAERRGHRRRRLRLRQTARRPLAQDAAGRNRRSEDDVEIQANSCVDRATVGETRIRAARRSTIWC